MALPAAGTIDPEWRIHARSASDDKAPLAALSTALDALKAAHIAPRSNIKFVFEGEEEAGSPHLAQIIAKYVGAKKHFVPGLLGLLNQFPVFQLMPANPTRICDFVAGETTSNRSWGAVIEQNFHQPKVGAFARLSLAKCKTALTSSGVTSKTSVISSTDIPASRFSNTV